MVVVFDDGREDVVDICLVFLDRLQDGFGSVDGGWFELELRDVFGWLLGWWWWW